MRAVDVAETLPASFEISKVVGSPYGSFLCDQLLAPNFLLIRLTKSVILVWTNDSLIHARRREIGRN